MTITKKILAATLPFFLLFGLVMLFLSIRSIENQGNQAIEASQAQMMSSKQEKLVDLVRNTFEILGNQYRIAHDPQLIAKAYENELRSVVNLAYSAIEAIYAETGQSDEWKQQEALKVVKSMRYAGDNYLWINDMQPKMVMHPIKPSLDGQDLSGFKDPKGKLLFNAMVEVCQKDGEGFVDYLWPKPGHEEPVAKLSYVRLFKPWNWVIGTGVYLEMAEQHFKEEAKKQIGNLRFGPDGNDYFFIVDTEVKTVMHPIKPALNGQDMTEFRDPQGKALFVEMVDVCKREGQGFVDYLWPKPGKDEPVPKLSYVQLFKEWGWIVGTGIYIDDIQQVMANQESEMRQALSHDRNVVIAVVGVMLLLVGGLITFLASTISKPIRATDRFFHDISEGEGDLTARLRLSSNDELGQMASSFNTFADKLQGMVSYIAQESVEINRSSDQLSSISSKLSEVAQNTLDQSATAAKTVERMSGDMRGVAGSMEETAVNVNTVSAAVEEMTSTINEIAETSEKARAITDNAVQAASKASVSVDELGTAAREITKVLETITEISQQVDLLALNATIEAARAGDAGKGFAVVANEIKDLASQTASATDQIRARIDSIQQTTKATVAVIENISLVVGENSEIVNTIATAVEEQSVTAREISQNVANISHAIQTMSDSVNQTSETSGEVSQELAQMKETSNATYQSAQTLDENAKSLDFMAKSLSKLVSTYKFK